jgi:PAS domain S-box-containing protein
MNPKRHLNFLLTVIAFMLVGSSVGYGGPGGHVVSGYNQGGTATGVAADVLQGKSISSIPEKMPQQERIIINKPDTALELYRKYLILVTLAIIALAGIIVWLWRENKSRKRAEETLRNREEIFSLFMKHSPFYTFIKQVTATENRVLQASDNFQQLIGIRAPEMIGKTMPELFPAEMADKIIADDWRVVSSGAAQEFEEDFNGRSFLTTKFPVVQGKKNFLAGYTIDITERKRVEAALMESELRFRSLLEDIPSVATQGYALDGTVLFWNRASELLYGYSSEETLGSNMLDLIIPDIVN